MKRFIIVIILLRIIFCVNVFGENMWARFRENHRSDCEESLKALPEVLSFYVRLLVYGSKFLFVTFIEYQASIFLIFFYIFKALDKKIKIVKK